MESIGGTEGFPLSARIDVSGTAENIERESRVDYSQRGEQGCDNPNFFDSVVAPAISENLPRPDSVPGKVIDHLTNVNSFLSTVRNDLCDDNRLSSQSGREALGFCARSIASIAVGTTTVGLAGVGLAVSGPVAAIGVLGVGAIAFLVAPSLAQGLTEKVADVASGLMDKTREWVQSHRGVV